MIIGVEQDHSSKANHDPSEHVRRENGVQEANETWMSTDGEEGRGALSFMGGSPGSQSMAAWLGFVKKRANSVDCNSADRQANQTKNLSS